MAPVLFEKLLPAAILLLTASPGPGAAETVEMEGEAFDAALRIEVQAEPEADSEKALLEAIAEVLAIEALTSPGGEHPAGLGAINQRAGSPAIAVDPRLHELLQRAQSFCHWSVGAHGPAGGNLYSLWGLRRSVGALPSPRILQQEVENAACESLQIDPLDPKAAVIPAARLDLWGFAAGFAVDRAVEILAGEGIENGYVQLGRITRAFGPGPLGEGWPVTATTGLEETVERVLLRDKALAVASASERSFEIGGDRYPPYLDQRTGRPPESVLGVFAVTDLAVDAEALAAALFVMPNREGRFRLGSLRPPPSAIWFLGTGMGPPLLAEYGWARLPKWGQPASDGLRRDQLPSIP